MSAKSSFGLPSRVSCQNSALKQLTSGARPWALAPESTACIYAGEGAAGGSKSRTGRASRRRHVGPDMLGETCWARHVGRDTLGETRWAREGEGGASRAIELGREKVAVRESSGERQEPWHPHTTERCEPARDPPRRALAETDPAERAPAFWVAHLVERVGSVCEYDCELVAISNASGEELSKEVESLFVGAL